MDDGAWSDLSMSQPDNVAAEEPQVAEVAKEVRQEDGGGAGACLLESTATRQCAEVEVDGEAANEEVPVATANLLDHADASELPDLPECFPRPKFEDLAWYTKHLYEVVGKWEVPRSALCCNYRDLFTGSSSIALVHEALPLAPDSAFKLKLAGFQVRH